MQELPERRSGKLQEGKRERGFNGVTQLSVSRSHAVLKEKKIFLGIFWASRWKGRRSGTGAERPRSVCPLSTWQLCTWAALSLSAWHHVLEITAWFPHRSPA